MKIYDLTFWIRISEDPRIVEDKIIKLIQDLGGKLEIHIPSKKRSLAYPIMKENYGYLGTVYFSCGPEVVEKITYELKKIRELLRYLIVERKSLPKNIQNKSEIETEDRVEKK